MLERERKLLSIISRQTSAEGGWMNQRVSPSAEKPIIAEIHGLKKDEAINILKRFGALIESSVPKDTYQILGYLIHFSLHG
ncbi:hypothetical protein [Pradoshia sp.]